MSCMPALHGKDMNITNCDTNCPFEGLLLLPLYATLRINSLSLSLTGEKNPSKYGITGVSQRWWALVKASSPWLNLEKVVEKPASDAKFLTGDLLQTWTIILRAQLAKTQGKVWRSKRVQVLETRANHMTQCLRVAKVDDTRCNIVWDTCEHKSSNTTHYTRKADNH